MGRFSNAIAQLANPQGRQKMTMAREYAEVAFRSRGGDLIHIFAQELLVRCNDFQQDFALVCLARLRL